jgi:neutral ceramidase
MVALTLVMAILICMMKSMAADQPTPNRVFRAGAAASNITPRIGGSIMGYFNERHSTNIHDELHARCLVLDDGQIQIAIVVCDNCMIPRAILDDAKRGIQQKTGLPIDHILISATHTHSAPTCTGLYLSETDKEYVPFLISRIVDGVTRAINNLAPAKVAWGVGHEPNQVFNRRWKMKPGSIPANPFGSTNEQVKMNPPVGSPDLIEPAGPTDPEVCLLSIQSPEGHPMALLANYSLHYVGTDRDKDVTADYYGAFCERITELLEAEHQDPPFVALLSNGTSGDINNINFRQKRPPQGPYDQIKFVADAVAREAARVCKELKYQDWVPLRMEQKEIRLAVRKPGPKDFEHAEALLAKAKGRDLRGLPEIYARETMFIKDYPDEVPVILQTIRIGDLGIAAVPCEVFAEIGLEIKKRSPLKPTFTIELANGCNGYLPTPGQHKLGGYETWRARSSYLETEASTKIVDALMEMFPKLQN